MTTKTLSAREHIECAKQTLDERTRLINDMPLIDAHDDLCNALDVLPPELSPAERNTVLAALRTYQEAGYGDPANRPQRIQDIACPSISDTSLDDAGIDELCEQLNCGDPCGDPCEADGWDWISIRDRFDTLSGALDVPPDDHAALAAELNSMAAWIRQQ